MKTQIVLISIFILSIFNVSAQKQQQEIVIVGTMHTVPKIVKKSYKPMLRFAKKYNPEAIYVESPMAKDDKSWEYLKNGWSKNYQQFYKLSDSLKSSFNFDEKKYHKLSLKKFVALTKEEIQYLITSSAYKRDNGNYELYQYLLKYGINGAKRPTRHEDGDLTYKLALAKNLRVKNMDDQQTNKEYHIAWDKCVKEGSKNGSNAAGSKINKKQYSAAKIPAIFRKLGKHTNKRKSLEGLHKMSSFSYVTQDTKGCLEGRKYWNERNMRMAKNIANQVLESGKVKNIVMVGASHVIGLEKELEKNYPNLKVILMNEY
ncbi:DUF5694 domain-containing protein [Polaribacter porphyrae]|uniref:TraB/GumN family protein n=1 Tax=Polaribacter porphyrae TaxID=1137780 RepID=A0A2S7WLL2_9FLAO|nr:DUF5694 domain-containing protein [Polaribacter porphyrae]PQJ78326.1 hypothetical protein BTO18_03585 [Polaribacter porphyrae]